ncbi:MAG: tetratricopeptide repeat protein [Candidatus Omnitrophica bacterium]|nr:tetratricopeptide repeat protein [Candidatus Omnitrophota bacterium]
MLSTFGKTKYLSKSFTQLVEGKSELAAIRREHSQLTPKDRTVAAAWSNDASIANFTFSKALAQVGQKGFAPPTWPCGYVALAIDPDYAPALLTVASIEYQLGRVDEALKLSLRLLELPPTTEDLVEIIDKAGDFLIDQKDWRNAHALYAAACQRLPQVPVFYSGLGYCLAKLGKRAEAIVAYRRAVELEPRSHLWLNDLGFSLTEAGQYNEALPILEQAAALAPPDYELAKNNLALLRGIMARSSAVPHADGG